MVHDGCLVRPGEGRPLTLSPTLTLTLNPHLTSHPTQTLMRIPIPNLDLDPVDAKLWPAPRSTFARLQASNAQA